MNMKLKSLGYEEFYYECFECPKCKNGSLAKTDKFCSKCGIKLNKKT